MKKAFVLSALLLSLVANAAQGDAVQLTFHRTGTDVGSVQVSVADHTGQAFAGVTASLQSVSFDAFKTAGAAAVTGGSVLAPDTYANNKNAQISYLFRIDGLPAGFTFNAADIDVYAMNAGGNPQYNTGNTVRYFQFEVATGGSADVSTFAVKHEDTDICTVPDQTNGLYHSIQTLTAGAPSIASDPLFLKVTLIKTSDLGCYAGIGAVTLYRQDDGGGGDEQPEGTFAADKFYTIHRNNNPSAYIYQNGGYMGTAQLDATKTFWWVFEPTGNPDCYYVKNATTGKYMQSSVQTLSTLVPVSDTPVEFQIRKDETPNAGTKGFYYLASTDQDISVETDATLGLNFGATGVVAYYIKSGRGNSYWQIEAGEYAYDPPVVQATDYAKSIQLYSIPCGAGGSAYLSAAHIEGDDVFSQLHYTAGAAPASYYTLFVRHGAEVRQGGTLPVGVTVANGGPEVRVFAYADWDQDGVFETAQQMSDGKATFVVPASAPLGQYRIRIRVTETDTDGPEDDVIGACYDFLVNIVPANTTLTWRVEPNDHTRGTVTADQDGNVLHLEATPLGNAQFIGWKRMNNHFQGEIVSTEPTVQMPLTESLRIVAMFTPNTQDTPVAIGSVRAEPAPTAVPATFDMAGRRTRHTSKGIIISSGKKWINK